MGRINSNKLDSQLKGKSIVLFVLSKAEYSEKILGLVDAVAKKTPNLCYVTVNKPASALINQFETGRINSKSFQFVDCIGHSVAGAPGTAKGAGKPVISVSSPRNLTELNIAISGVMGGKSDSVFIDALTTLLIYNDGLMVIRFAHNLISTLREHEKSGYFVALKNDISSSLLDDLSMFVDGVVEV